jgi:hypothetical protein
MRGGRRRRRELGMLLLGRGGGTLVFLDSCRMQLKRFLVRYEWHLNSAGLLGEVSPSSVFGGFGLWRKYPGG